MVNKGNERSSASSSLLQKAKTIIFRPRSRRVKAIISRWLDVFCYTVVGISIVVFCSFLYASWIKNVLKPIEPLGWAIYFISAVIVFAILTPFWKGRFFGWAGLHHPLAYPPTWYPGVLGAIIIITFYPILPPEITAIYWGGANFDGKWLYYVGCLIISIFLIVCLGAFGCWLSRSSKIFRTGINFRNEDTDSKDLYKDTKDLIDWIRDDNPVSIPAQDRFSYVEIAERISKRLMTDTTSGQPSLAVIGNFGSGKTSLGNLVKGNLSIKSNNSIVLINISIWPYDSPVAAVHAILRAITREISKHVNVTALLSIDNDYSRLIVSAGGVWASLMNFFSHREEPADILKRYDAIAQAIGLKIVVWIEDLERFLLKDVTPKEQDSVYRAERLAPIRSLLVNLDGLESLGVVVVSNSLHFGEWGTEKGYAFSTVEGVVHCIKNFWFFRNVMG